MKKSLIIALFAALPAFAQEEAPQAPAPQQPCACGCAQRPDGPGAGKREARRAEFEKKMLEKFDANKDGQLDDQEKAAMKAEFEKRRAERGDRGPRGCKGPRPDGPKGGFGPQGPRHGHGGPRPDGAPQAGPGGFHHGPAARGEACKAAFLEKFDVNKDGKIDDQEKEAVKAAHEARRAEFEKKMLEKFDANKDGQLDDQEKAAMKAEFEKRRAERGDRGPRGCKGPRPDGPKGGFGPKGPKGCPGCGPKPEGAPAPEAPAPEAPAPEAPAEA